MIPRTRLGLVAAAMMTAALGFGPSANAKGGHGGGGHGGGSHGGASHHGGGTAHHSYGASRPSVAHYGGSRPVARYAPQVVAPNRPVYRPVSRPYVRSGYGNQGHLYGGYGYGYPYYGYGNYGNWGYGNGYGYGSAGSSYYAPSYPSTVVVNPVAAVDPGAALGISVAPVADGYGAALQVLQVAPGSPAEAAGIRPGDLITSANGYQTRSLGDLSWIEANASPSGVLAATLRPASGGPPVAVAIPLR